MISNEGVGDAVRDGLRGANHSNSLAIARICNDADRPKPRSHTHEEIVNTFLGPVLRRRRTGLEPPQRCGCWHGVRMPCRGGGRKRLGPMPNEQGQVMAIVAQLLELPAVEYRMVLKQPSQRARGLRPGLHRRGLGQCHHRRQVQHAVHPPQHGAKHHQKRQPADQRTRTPAAMGWASVKVLGEGGHAVGGARVADF